MTKKDFEALAEVVCFAHSVEGPIPIAWWAHELADVCTKTNPRFDRARFLKACGVV